MSARHKHIRISPEPPQSPGDDDLGRLFLKPNGINRLVVASPGDILVRCDLPDQPRRETDRDRDE